MIICVLTFVAFDIAMMSIWMVSTIVLQVIAIEVSSSVVNSVSHD